MAENSVSFSFRMSIEDRVALDNLARRRGRGFSTAAVLRRLIWIAVESDKPIFEVIDEAVDEQCPNCRTADKSLGLGRGNLRVIGPYEDGSYACTCDDCGLEVFAASPQQAKKLVYPF